MINIGSGDGRMSEDLEHRRKLIVTSIDIVNRSVTGKPALVFDGKKIPFADKSFDYGLLSLVLHHTLNQEELLREAKRVTRNKLVVIEHAVDGFLAYLLSWLFSFVGAIIFVQSPMSMKFRSDQAWKQLFSKMGFAVRNEKTFSLFNGRFGEVLSQILPVSRKVYVLEQNH
jgi:ubiquinone/menaquinone biosynthesis C-methylase UbiE